MKPITFLRRAREASVRHHVRSGSPGSESGMTLVEVLVAMAVFTIFITSAVLSFESTLGATTQNRGRTVAASLLAQELDTVYSMPFSGVVGLNGHSAANVVGPTTFTIGETVQEINPPTGAGTGSCSFTAAGTDGRAVVVNVSVSWPAMAGNPETAQIELSPSANAISLKLATLSVQVVDAKSQPVVGAAVAIDTNPIQRATTDTNGCATFVSLPPNVVYTVSASSLIDQTQGDQGSNPALAQWTSAALSPGSYTSAPLVFDHPTSVKATLSVPATFTAAGQCLTGRSVLCPSVSGLSLHLTAGQAVDGNAADTLSGLSMPENVFPFTAGWQASVGDCADASVDHVNVVTVAGAVTSVPVPAVGVTLTVAKPALSRGTVFASHAPDSGCLDGETLRWQNVSGTTINLALPAGSWTFYRSTKPVPPLFNGVTLTLPTQRTGTLP